MSAHQRYLDENTSLEADKSLALWEIASVITSCLLGEWVIFSIGKGNRLALAVLVLIVSFFMFLSHRLRKESTRDLGLRLDNFLEAARLLALPMCLASGVAILVAYLNGTLSLARWRGGQSILGMPALGILWALVQQYALQAFINRRAQLVWGRGLRSVLFVALMFAALHLPNPLLCLATFAGGMLWAAVYQRAPNLFALALSHALMTWVLVSTVPASLLGGLRVGFKYFG
ncbi:MAG: CPBP family glutamic-type intramembrane protease [Pyrinomonadaceae bacterium]